MNTFDPMVGVPVLYNRPSAKGTGSVLSRIANTPITSQIARALADGDGMANCHSDGGVSACNAKIFPDALLAPSYRSSVKQIDWKVS